MKSSTLTFILLYLGCVALAQPVNWVKAIGSGNYDYGTCIAVDSLGNSYTTGFFYGKADFDTGPEIYYLNAESYARTFLLKLDKQGNFVWAKEFEINGGIIGESIAIDQSGNLYLAGRFGGKCDFDPGSGNFPLEAQPGSQDLFVAKFDTSGNFYWAKQMGGVTQDYNSMTGVNSIDVDRLGNIYVTGEINSTVYFDPAGLNKVLDKGNGGIYVLKLDTQGNLSWAKNFGKRASGGANSISVDDFGNSYLIGGFMGTLDFDPVVGAATLFSPGGNSDAFIIKLDPNGKYIWANQFGGTYDDYAISGEMDPNGDLVIAGYFTNTTDFTPSLGIFTNDSQNFGYSFIIKVDANGNLKWANGIKGDGICRIGEVGLDSKGDIFVTGGFSNTINVGAGSNPFFLKSENTTTDMGTDIAILKMDKQGKFIWAKAFPGKGSDIGNSIVIDNSDNIYVTGSIGGGHIESVPVNFNPEEPAHLIQTQGYEDIFILKLGLCLLAPPAALNSIIGTDTTCKNGKAEYSVDKGVGVTNYVWTAPPDARIVSGQNTNAIKVDFGQASGYIIVTPQNSCAIGKPDSLYIDNIKLTHAEILSRDTLICPGTYSILRGKPTHPYEKTYWKSINPNTKLSQSGNNAVVSNLSFGANIFTYQVYSDYCSAGTPDSVLVQMDSLPVIRFKDIVNHTYHSEMCEVANVSLEAEVRGNLERINWFLNQKPLAGTTRAINIPNVKNGDKVTMVGVPQTDCGVPLTDSVEVLVDKKPVAGIAPGSNSIYLCPGEDTLLTALEIIPEYMYSWVRGNGISIPGTSLNITNEGRYFLHVQNGACTSTAFADIKAIALSVNINASKTEFNIGDTIILSAVASGNVANQQVYFEWSPSGLAGSPVGDTLVVQPAENMVVNVKATTIKGCVAQSIIHLVKRSEFLVPDEIFFVPNAITSSSDDQNAYWAIKGTEQFPGLEVKVFNRWGMTVHQQTGYSSPWDGSINGKPLPTGTYYYVINHKKFSQPLVGDLTILR